MCKILVNVDGTENERLEIHCLKEEGVDADTCEAKTGVLSVGTENGSLLVYAQTLNASCESLEENEFW